MTPPEPPRDGPLTANKAGLPTRFSQASPHLGADVLPVARPAVFSCFLSRPKSTSPENQNQLAPRPHPDKSGASDQGCHPPSQLPAPVQIRSRTRLWHSPSPRLPTSTAAGFFPRPRPVTSKDFELVSLQPFLLFAPLPTWRCHRVSTNRTSTATHHRIDLGYPSICSCPGTWWQRRKLSISPPGFRRRTRRRRDSRPTATAARLVVLHDSQLFAMRNEIT